ncbi:hypothetical protein FQZ97_944240 [compost metagenome]
MAAAPDDVMASPAERRHRGEFQGQGLRAISARYMVQVKAAIDAPGSVHDPLSRGTTQQARAPTLPFQNGPASVTTDLPQTGRQEFRELHRPQAVE